MKMVRAIIRPEKEHDVRPRPRGRGLPRHDQGARLRPGQAEGLQVGPVRYDMLPKVLLLLVVNDGDVQKVLTVITDTTKTGFIGDGKIFVSGVDEAVTVRTGEGL